MIIKKQITFGAALINYEVVLQGEAATPFSGVVVVHDPKYDGGRKRGFLVPEGLQVPNDHVVICRIAFK